MSERVFALAVGSCRSFDGVACSKSAVIKVDSTLDKPSEDRLTVQRVEKFGVVLDSFTISNSHVEWHDLYPSPYRTTATRDTRQVVRDKHESVRRIKVETTAVHLASGQTVATS